VRSRRAWILFGAGAGAVIAALAWTSAMVLRLERAEGRARAEARFEQAMRLGVARAGALLEQLLALEQVRPTYEYQPYYSHEKAYTRILCEIEPGEVLTPSPLLSLRSDFIRVHFSVAEGRPPASPQIPEGNLQDLAEATLLDPAAIERSRAALASIAPHLEAARLEAALPRPPEGASGAARDEYEQTKRSSQKAILARSPLATTEPLSPVWLGDAEGAGEPALVYLRRVRLGEERALQGFLVDRGWLEAALLEEMRDPLPGAALRPQRGRAFPYEIVAAAPAGAGAGRVTPYAAGLAILWAAALAALALLGAALGRSLRYGRDRQRFASSVTHELRTPLTTFQLYSEMLAKGMVREEAKRKEYLETLVEKSHSLAAMVENVLAYARLEEKGARGRREEVTLGALLDRVAPPLRARAEEAGFRLATALSSPDVRVAANLEAVSQILYNLVDNACKYAAGAADRTIRLGASVEEGQALLEVRDRGPGVPPRAGKAIFTPFDRGGRGGADPVPGLGLGLALSRGLARDLGGDLELRPSEEGARFALRLPLLEPAPRRPSGQVP